MSVRHTPTTQGGAIRRPPPPPVGSGWRSPLPPQDGAIGGDPPPPGTNNQGKAGNVPKSNKTGMPTTLAKLLSTILLTNLTNCKTRFSCICTTSSNRLIKPQAQKSINIDHYHSQVRKNISPRQEIFQIIGNAWRIRNKISINWQFNGGLSKLLAVRQIKSHPINTHFQSINKY